MIQPTTALALGQARLAELHHQAQRRDLARRVRQRDGGHPASRWNARALTRYARLARRARQPESR